MKAFLSFRKNPVRVAVYGALVLAITTLVASGKVDMEAGNIVIGVLGVLLAVGGAEVARSQVTPTSKVEAAISAGVDKVVNDAQGVLAQARQEVDQALAQAPALPPAAAGVVAQATGALEAVRDVIGGFLRRR